MLNGDETGHRTDGAKRWLWTLVAPTFVFYTIATSRGADVLRRLLGVTPGNGKALGLDEAWAYNVVKTVGNYAEVYERNVGTGSPIKLPRGVNALWSAGGLMFAPPLR